jgi:hypothetical protein
MGDIGDLYMQELLRRGKFDVQPAATGPRAKIPKHDRTRLRFARDSMLEGTRFDSQFRLTRASTSNNAAVVTKPVKDGSADIRRKPNPVGAPALSHGALRLFRCHAQPRG